MRLQRRSSHLLVRMLMMTSIDSFSSSSPSSTHAIITPVCVVSMMYHWYTYTNVIAVYPFLICMVYIFFRSSSDVYVWSFWFCIYPSIIYQIYQYWTSRKYICVDSMYADRIIIVCEWYKSNNYARVMIIDVGTIDRILCDECIPIPLWRDDIQWSEWHRASIIIASVWPHMYADHLMLSYLLLRW